MWRTPAALAGAVTLGLAGLGLAVANEGRGPAAVDSARMAAQEKDGTDWLHDGRTYSAQRYSPLTQIDAGNVSKLGIAWYDDLDTFRGVEATPIYADGVLYNILPWNITIAYDARTGKRLWTYDPKGLRAGIARSRHVEGQDHHRHAGRAPDRARCGDGQAGVDHADLRS